MIGDVHYCETMHCSSTPFRYLKSSGKGQELRNETVRFSPPL